MVYAASSMKFLAEPRSGSQAGTTSSRNRFGQYTRNRATPVQPRTVAQLAQRSRQTTNAAAWRTLTSTQRDGWTSLGLMISRTDSLGQTYNLTGFQAYCSVNNNLLTLGSSTISDAPALSTPTGVASVTLTLTGGGSPAFSVAFTPTPLGSGEHVIVRCSPQRSAGRSFEGDYRVIFVGAAASTSPSNILTAYQAKFGTPVSGNKIFVGVSRSVGGFESPPFNVAQVVA
jgi:hypothetical protein